MILIDKNIVPAEKITNVEDMESLIDAKIENALFYTIDLENGRIATLTTFYDNKHDSIVVGVMEKGILTQKVFAESCFVVFEGIFGIEIHPWNTTYESYDKYKKYIDEMILIILDNEVKKN